MLRLKHLLFFVAGLLMIAGAVMARDGQIVRAQEATVAASPSDGATPVGKQMDWVLRQLNGGAAELTEQELNDHFTPDFLAAFPVPLLVILVAYILYKSLIERREYAPFAAAIGLFFLSYVGLGISFYPYLVPTEITIWDAAAPDSSLAFVLLGAAVLLPLIIVYTAYSYWVFRGKVSAEGGYH